MHFSTEFYFCGLSKYHTYVVIRKETDMLKRILIGLMVVIFVLIGIHLSWGRHKTKTDGRIEAVEDIPVDWY